ncbi:MFS transporter [Nonomuraea sp. NPDC050153]|uniref:MFS transporter n=1 Tax=Nonomuraea sp. NPDC050153 TaxID=3364359 RepID=UPI00379B211A
MWNGRGRLAGAGDEPDAGQRVEDEPSGRDGRPAGVQPVDLGGALARSSTVRGRPRGISSSGSVLPMAALILTAGVFGDVHGRKKVYIAGLAMCAAGAALALSAGSIAMVWAGQALSGLGAAALLPTTLALISHAVPDPRERGRFIGLWATSLMTALACGPIIAGVILDHAAWRWIYLLPIPISLIALAVAARLLPGSRAAGTRRLDWPGQLTAWRRS